MNLMKTTRGKKSYLVLTAYEAGVMAAAIEYAMDNAPYIKPEALETLTMAYPVLASYGMSEVNTKVEQTDAGTDV